MCLSLDGNCILEEHTVFQEFVFKYYEFFWVLSKSNPNISYKKSHSIRLAGTAE